MKSIIGQIENKQYPWLGVSRVDGTIVLFTDPKTGVCVYAEGASRNKLGEYCSCWTESNFYTYRGEVALQN